MNRLVVLASATLFSVLGCHSNSAKPTRTIALVDISGSIYPEEVDREFSEMQKLASTLKRGDELILLPIMGNARNDTPGRIVRLTAPTTRAAFDADIVTFRRQAGIEIGEMRDWAKRNPAKHTDILGSLDIASHEIVSTSSTSTELLVLSDFLEDDGQLNFVTDRALAYSSTAYALAVAQEERSPLALHNICISTIRLRSRDFATLSHARQTAVDTFWVAILAPGK